MADGAVADGGPAATDWAAHLFTAGPDGTPTGTAVDSDPAVPAPVDGLALGGGKLYTVERGAGGGDYVYDRSIQPGSPPSYGPEPGFSDSLAPTDCDTAATCNPPFANGDGSISRLRPGDSAQGDTVAVRIPDLNPAVPYRSKGGGRSRRW
ncbi:hypothetical protein [Streptomyces monashensis]|uniref:Uncharacterized protein n=1 Tax=Streptomyces monashensis TaxID=1678012 RepID=A0A1S2PS21_9ACTN|nr:hypothetical protein [Streptomyces monashensis]OIJ96346.1 hypothetical protein BIV23_32895 [Streptomyces monashensis]